MRRGRPGLPLVSVGVLVALFAVGTGLGGTIAAFSDVASNPSDTFSAAASFCAPTGTQTVGATRDSWISQASPAQNKGTDSGLYVTSKSGNANERSLVYISLPALPVGCSVTSATLRLYNESPVAGRSIQALRVTAAWTENGVTWTNQPATTGAAAVSASPASAGWQSWTVTSQVQAMYAGANHGFLLRDATEDAAAGPVQKYRSRETGATFDPELIVNWG